MNFRAAPAVVAILFLGSVGAPAAHAQAYQVIHNFTGGVDGANPWAGLTIDAAGNLYGVSEGGGNGSCVFYGTSGCGTAFKLTSKSGSWIFGPLYSFAGGSDGEFPVAAVTIGPNGSPYGTTAGGGSGTCTFYQSTGCGTVFNLRPPVHASPKVLDTWTDTVLYRFSGGSDGAGPNLGNVVFDQAGNLYGTTLSGGAFGQGVVFELSPSGSGWTETVLYNFAGGSDGSSPYSGLVFDKAGNLYGTTSSGGGSGCGGTGCGTVYELTPSGSGWIEQIIYGFQGGSDGAVAEGGLIVDQSGNLYGGTYTGGSGGGGTVYELTPASGGWTFSVLYSFIGTQWGLVNLLTMDPAGNLYGTTQYGGPNGDGNVFELTPFDGSWIYTDLHDFTYGSDGGGPTSRLVLDSSGNLYGTTFGGGAYPCGGNGCGVVFELTPSPPNFTVSASPSSFTILQGNQGTSTITTSIGGGFDSAITLSASGVPTGTTVSFNPNPIPAPGAGSSTMTITVGASTPPGTYTITVTGNGGGIQQNTTVMLTVMTAPIFTMSVYPASLSIVQGNQEASTVTTTVDGGFNSAITLSASGVPSGTTVSFSPNPIPAPGVGNSTMTITVGASTAIGTYPITVTGNGGGVQQNTMVMLTVLSSSAPVIGFDFRATSTFITDPSGDTYVLSTTSYPTTFNGVNFGWANVNLIQARDRNSGVDPRLAGINFANNGSPGSFYVDLPSGTYDLALALGDDGYLACPVQCQIQFLDGSTILATLTEGEEGAGYFYDAQGNNWSAANWPNNNVRLRVAIAGTQLTMVTGSNQNNGDYTPVAFLGITQVTLAPNFLISPFPASFSIAQGSKATSTITTTISGGFNSAITLSASGLPAGATVSFNPNPIPAPGAGSSTMTITVGSSTPLGTYPITVTANGGGVQQSAVVTLTVTPSDFILTADPPTVTVQQGSAGPTTVRTTLLGNFNSAISLSASGMPSGTTVSFNPNPIPAPGGGTSTMTIMVGANTPLGTYPITVTGNGAGLQHSFTVTLVVISSVWQQGFDFRGSLNFVNDPPGATGVVSTTIFPTVGGLTTYGWSYTAYFLEINRNNSIDPRLAGTNYVNNGTPGQFYVDLPAPGTYSLSLAMGDDGWPACSVQCQVQFLDGSTVLATVTGGPLGAGFFYDAQGNVWSAAQWPASNVSQQVTLVGTQLTVQVGSNQDTGDYTSIAYLGVTQVSAGPTFALQAAPSVSVGQGQYSTADVLTILIGGFNSAINLSAAGGPAGTTVTFNPSTIPAPGAGTSIMRVSVPNNAPLGNYTLTVTASGGGIVQNASVALTVTATDPPSFTLAAPNAMSAAPGGQVKGTVVTTVTDGFNSAISLSATGGPGGTSISFNPSTIPAPGSGSSSMTVNVPAGSAFGSYPITLKASSGQGNQTATFVLTVSASGGVNLPSGTGWQPLSTGLSFCDVSPGYAYYNPDVGAVDAFNFLASCETGGMVAYGGGAADTTNERYFLWTSGHNNYQGNEMYVLNLEGASPTVARVTNPSWTVDNTNVPPDCACNGTNNCGEGLWHDGAGNPVSSPYLESAHSGPTFESTPAPDGSYGQPSCGYGARFTPNARETYAGIVYNSPANQLFTWGGAPAADPTGFMFSNWTLNLNQNPAQWARLKDSSYSWITAAAYDYTSGHSTSGSDLVFDENEILYTYNPSTDTYKVLSNTLPYIGYNVNMDLDPLHHYLIMENGDDTSGGEYHLRILNIDSCNGASCTITNLDSTASCKGALGYWAGITWDSKRSVMAIFPSSTNCSGAGCTGPFNTVYLLNPDPNNPVTITYQGQKQTIQPQQCFAASYGSTPPTSYGPGVYGRFKYYPNEDIYLYIPDPSDLWVLRLEQ